MADSITAVVDSRVNDELARLLVRMREHERRLGRKLRVLHVGNIANNALHNAKLMRRAGLDCDVVCNDYYHIMGCPEWEDADFDGDVGDHFRPRWWPIDLHGYERPRWFVQGPIGLCLDYLLAYRCGNVAEADRLWRLLTLHNRTRAGTLGERFALQWQRIPHLFERLMRFLLLPERVREKFGELAQDWQCSASSSRRLSAPLLRAVRGPIVWLSSALVALSAGGIRHGADDTMFRARAEALRRRFAEAFPERADRLHLTDLMPYASMVNRWARLFEHYDIVQGYATDPVLPMLVGRPYFAFEHGTLREIPFWSNARGRLTALAYHKAQHVFVTNSDCLPNARRLASNRVTLINHPFDEDNALAVRGWERLRVQLCASLDADFLFFHPTRQDWVPGTGYADKANDVFLNALAVMRAQGLRVGLVACAWGRNVEASRALLRDLGMDRHVRWEPPMAVRKFLRTARACGIVVDQFRLGAFGGVTFKSLAAGVPVCTRLDEDEARTSFGVAPPVINCSTREDLLLTLPPLIQDRGRLETLARASREWIEHHHGGRQVLAAQVRAYLDHLDETVAAP